MECLLTEVFYFWRKIEDIFGFRHQFYLGIWGNAFTSELDWKQILWCHCFCRTQNTTHCLQGFYMCLSTKSRLIFRNSRKLLSHLWLLQFNKQSYSCNYNYSCNRFKYSNLRPSKYLQKPLSQFIPDTVSDNTCVWQTVQLGVLTNLINSTSGHLVYPLYTVPIASV